MSVTEAIYWMIFLAGLLGALFRPICGVLLYVLTYNVHPATQWWGANVAAFLPRIFFVIAIATGIGMILNWRSLNREQKQFPLMFSLMIMFLVYCYMASVSSTYPLGNAMSRVRIDKLGRIGIFIFMMIRVVRSSTEFRMLLWAWMAGTIYIGYEAWSGIGITISGRLSGGLGGPDFNQSSGLSAHLVPMVAFAGFLFYSSRRSSAKFFALLAGAFAINTIILTRTRNAFPGLIVLIIFGLIRLPRGVRLKCLLGILIGVPCALYLTDKGWWDRMATLKHPDQDESITARFDYWNAAVAMANDHIWGVGVGNFRNEVPLYVADLHQGRSAHSTYFQCLGELGYPGLMLYLSVIGAAFFHFEWARGVGRRWLDLYESNPELAEEQRVIHLMATANEVAVCGFLVSAAFTSRLWAEGAWLMLGMSGCLHNIALNLNQRLKEHRTTAAADPRPAQTALLTVP